MNSAVSLNVTDLGRFSGCRSFYRHWTNRSILFTEGMRYVAEQAHAYWLIDLVAFAQQNEHKVSALGLQVWKLLLRQDRSATLLCEDGADNIIYSLALSFVDFPLERMTIFVAHNIIHLASEY